MKADKAIYDVTVVLLDAGFATTALMPIEIFHSAGALWRELRGEMPEPRFRVTAVSMDGKPIASPYAGLSIAPQAAISDIVRTDVIIVPASGPGNDDELRANGALLPWLRDHYAKGAYVAGVCTGAAYLAESGLLDGKKGTTHWCRAPYFSERWPAVEWTPDMFVTEDARLLCSGGVTAAADVSLYLVEKLCGHEVAMQTAKALLLNMPRNNQSGYATLPLSPPHNDDAVRAVERVLQTKFAEPHSIESMADSVALSPRTFLRRFKAATGRMPGSYLQAVRIEMAKAMLERDRATVQSVASAVGYDDVSFFRSLFRRETGMTPGDYRTRFASVGVRHTELMPGSAG